MSNATLSVPLSVYEGAMGKAVTGNDMLAVLDALVDNGPSDEDAAEYIAEQLGDYTELELQEDADNLAF